MPIIRLLNDEVGGEQAFGNANRSTRKLLYAFDPKTPLDLHEFGGHGIPDAPEYAIVEPTPQMVRRTVSGYNQTTLKHVDDEYIQGEDYTLNLPERRLTLAHMMVQVQRRENRLFHWALIPTDECPDDCDRFAELMGDSGRLGEIQNTGSAVAFDVEGDGGAITKTVMLRIEGDTDDFHGVEIGEIVESTTDAIYAIAVGSRFECSNVGSFCPYQVGFVFSAAGSVTAPLGDKTLDKWGAKSALDLTALTVAGYINDFVEWRGDYYIAEASTNKASSSTFGSVWKSAGGTAAFADTGITSLGIQALVVAGSKLHAFGEAGEWHFTSDGENWTTQTGAPLGSNSVFCAAYNPITKRIYTGGDSGAAFVIKNAQVTLALTGFGSELLFSCHVAGDDHVVYGTSVGKIIEHFSESEDGGAFTTTKDFGAGAIHFLGGDRNSVNLVASVADKVHERSIKNKQDWLEIGTAPGTTPTILAGGQGFAEHRRGTDYYVFGTDNGDIFEVETCAPCSL